MSVVFRVVYSLAVAILLILSVIFGTRTLYSEPDYPQYPFVPDVPGSPTKNIYCPTYSELREVRCYVNDVLITPAIEDGLTNTERAYLESQREYARLTFEYEDDRETYYRNVFIIAGFLGVLAIAAAVFLYRRVDAMPLGLLLGGIGSLIYGWVEWAQGPDEAGTAVVFVVVTIGFIVVLAGGYWFLGREDRGPPEAPKEQ